MTHTLLPGFTADAVVAEHGHGYMPGLFAGHLEGAATDDTVVPQAADAICYAGCMTACSGTTGFGFGPFFPIVDMCRDFCLVACAMAPDFPPPRPPVFDPFPLPPTPPPTPTPFLPTGIGGTGGWGAAAGWLLVDIAAIAWAVHDISKAAAGPTEQPPVTSQGCAGGFIQLGNVTGYSVPFVYPGCAGAFDHALANAQEMCDRMLTCSGTCPDGQKCRPLASMNYPVDQTRMVVTCEAIGSYRCDCGCYQV